MNTGPMGIGLSICQWVVSPGQIVHHTAHCHTASLVMVSESDYPILATEEPELPPLGHRRARGQRHSESVQLLLCPVTLTVSLVGPRATDSKLGWAPAALLPAGPGHGVTVTATESACCTGRHHKLEQIPKTHPKEAPSIAC